MDPSYTSHRMTPARTVARAFQGTYKLAEAIGVAPSTVYRWSYGKDDCGLIPQRYFDAIMRAAKQRGIIVTEQHLTVGLKARIVLLSDRARAAKPFAHMVQSLEVE